MGIYIKGMEMPENCVACPLETDYGTCGYYSLFVETGHDSEVLKRRDDCPLVEVPPHGRLIDADAFCEKVLEIVERQKYDDFYAKSLSVGAILREVVRELRGEGFDGFDNAPTIIPAEEGK